MLQRGRKSPSAQTVQPVAGKPVPPPKDMPAAQAAIWRAVVATKPPSWFTADSLPILKQFCRHAATTDQLQARIEALPADVSLADWTRWLALRDAESKTTLRLATSLRLTPHSRLKAETAATQHAHAGDADKPWANE